MQEKLDIAYDETAGTLHDRLMLLGAETLFSTVELIDSYDGKPPAHKQNNGEATGAPKIFKEDCRIDFNRSVDEVYDFIRGLSPYPGAYTEYNEKIIKIYGAVKMCIRDSPITSCYVKVVRPETFSFFRKKV